MLKINRFPLFLPIVILLFASVSPLLAGELLQTSKGQTVYVPAYSHIYHGNKEAPLLLSITLSIRNVSPDKAITVTVVDYHATQGDHLKHFLTEPFVLGPFGSERFIVPQKDDTGGSGANFVVKWHSETPVSPPIIETVMIGSQNQLGISFTSRGQAIQE